MDFLKLVALDEDDLEIVSAHLQDAVMRVGGLAYRPREMQFAAEVNRFVWEKNRRFFNRAGERRRAIVHFDRVKSVQANGIDRDRPDDILSLLAIRFIYGEGPAGTLELDFAGDATLRLNVECIEVRLTDMGAAWETQSRPDHGL